MIPKLQNWNKELLAIAVIAVLIASFFRRLKGLKLCQDKSSTNGNDKLASSTPVDSGRSGTFAKRRFFMETGMLSSIKSE